MFQTFTNSEGFISPSTSMTLLQDSVITNTLDDQANIIKENSNTLPRARWNNNRKSRLPQSRQGTIIIEGNDSILFCALPLSFPF